MTEQQITDKLFHYSWVTGRYVRNIQKCAYLPDYSAWTDEDAERWRDTFSGRLLTKKNGKTLANWMAKYNDGRIPELMQLDRHFLRGFMEYARDKVSPNTLVLFSSILKAVMNDFKTDEYDLPCDNFSGNLRARKSKSDAVYLTEKEVERLMKVRTMNEREEYVKKIFGIGCLTGMRFSDAVRMNDSYLQGEELVYTSQKTRITARIPAGERLRELLSKPDIDMQLYEFEKRIKDLCRRCRITDDVTIYQKGGEITRQKCDFVTAHTARRSFATNLALRNVPLQTIRDLAGHTNIAMTEHYIKARTTIGSENMDFFR